jgi:adenylate kinase family enzyme
MTAGNATAQVRSGNEYPVVAAVRLRAMRRALWMRQLWALEPGAAHPAAISDEELDRILADPVELSGRETAFYQDDPSAAALSRAVEEVERVPERNWERLVSVLELERHEQRLFALAVAHAIEPSLGRAFAYLHDQPEMIHATPWLAGALYDQSESVPTQSVGRGLALGNDSALLRWHLVSRAPDSIPVQGKFTGWVADPKIVAWLVQGNVQDLPSGATLHPQQVWDGVPLLYPEIFASAGEFLSAIAGETDVELEFLGPDGSGRGTLAGQVAACQGMPLISVAESDLLEGVSDADAAHVVLLAARSARLHGAVLYWREGWEPKPVARRALRSTKIIRIVGRTAPFVESPSQGVFRSYTIQPLSRKAREQLWSVSSECPLPWQVRDWLLAPGEIVQLARVAQAGDEAILQACHRPRESLNLLVKLPLPFDPKELILPNVLQKALDDFENQVRYRWDVYEQWGFERLCPNGRGLIALFAGPSGTGKTMAAQVLARRLGLELYRLDPAQVVNKYIGETEKRLKAIFDECDRAHFLLLIDECEGMFGQRFTSKDAHDRYANLEIDYLLQRLERFQGIAILSTNRKGDLDSGFVRRIRVILDFLPPGPAERAQLWANALPSHSPSGEELLDSCDWSELAERVQMTGAEINLAALGAAFLARSANQKIGSAHVLEAVRHELAKKGQTLRGFE